MSRPAALSLATLRIALVILFAGASIANVLGLPVLVDEFDRIGLGQGFRYLTALTQMAGAVLLLRPATAPAGGLLLLGVSVGACLAQALALHGDIIHTIVLIAAVALLAWTDTHRWITAHRLRHAAPQGTPAMSKAPRLLLAILALTLPALAAPARATTPEDTNKTLVLQFYTMAFIDHQPEAAAARYLSPSYIQHNPRLPDGPDAFAAFFQRVFTENPAASSSIKRVIAQDDLVVIHSHAKRTQADRGTAIVDIFRVEAGRIAEHWDVIQPVPETSASGHPMF